MELDHYRVIKTKCSEDAATLNEYIEQDRVYDFPVGLNSEFDQGTDYLSEYGKGIS